MDALRRRQINGITHPRYSDQNEVVAEKTWCMSRLDVARAVSRICAMAADSADLGTGWSRPC